MCGINGLVSASRKEISKMNRLVAHRGPDGEGIFLDDNIGLGHQRLAILDLSRRASQPMVSTNKQYAIVFNGEIYNFLELRKKLDTHFKFFSGSDTEVILNGYIKWGSKIVNKLNGMFAFSIYDKKKGVVFCARDKFGEKPLYYSETPRFSFSSEIKAVLSFTKSRLNLSKLDEFITKENTYGKGTLFEGIYELEPAHYLEYSLKTKKIEIRKYWDLRIDIDLKTPRIRWLQKIRNKVNQSVKSRTISDVPVGTYLSGGLDSSAITAFTSRHLPYKTHSFCLIFDDKNIESEKKYMNAFLKRYKNVKNHFVRLDAKKYWDNFVYCTWINDYPLVFPAHVAQFFLAKEAKKYITVVLSGEGGDEIFGGYHRHRMAKYAKGFYQGKGSLVLFKILQGLSLLTKKPGNFFVNLILTPELSQFLTINFFHIFRKKQLYGYRLKGYIASSSNTRALDIETNQDYLSRYLYTEINYYLKTLLHKQDRMNMAVGVESRCPFLDAELVEEFINIPQSLKVTQKSGKVIFKEAMEKELPKIILEREKEGFKLPIDNWLEEIDWGSGLLDDSQLSKDGLLNQKAIDYYKRKRNAKGIYFLLALEVWYRLFIKDEKQIELRKKLTGIL